MVDGFINFNLNEKTPTIIKVIGVGGGGGNAVEYMYEKGICDVDFVICNTDYQALRNSPIPCKIQLGKELTAGHGAGNNPAMTRRLVRWICCWLPASRSASRCWPWP